MSAAILKSDVQVFSDAEGATSFAAEWLAGQLANPATKNVMLAGGNTPLGLYAAVAERSLDVSHVNTFVLDEYVGVPLDEPRNCANLIRTSAVVPWGLSAENYHWISSVEAEALDSIIKHEEKICVAGGLDLVVLGLGRNGHVGFNEPGSEPDSTGRITKLDPVSLEANRNWFKGQYAPRFGVTTGMKLILTAKQVLLLAFGTAKAQAVSAMLEGTVSSICPASFLQRHANVLYVLDQAAAAELRQR